MASRVQRDQERRAKAEAFRKAQQQRERRRRLLVIGIPVLVVIIIAVVVVVVVTSGRGSNGAAGSGSGSQIVPTTPTGTTTDEKAAKCVKDTSGISGVLAWDTQGWPGDGTAHAGALQHDHVTGPVDYTETPPVGGPHDAVWMNAGVYTKAIPTERAVHNLEHGAVWITYDPSLPASTVKKLTAFVTKQSMIAETEQGVTNQANRYIDMSPWTASTLPSPIVISAWGHQLRVTSPTDPRLQQFVDTFRHNPTYTPEYGAAVDGIPVQTGGRPATDGSRKPNPAGSAAG